MRWRQVVLFYVVLGAMAGEYWLVERHAPPPPPEHPVRQRFLTVEPDDVREMRLFRGGRTVVTERREGRWEVIDPPDATVPGDLIAAFANALTRAEEIDVMGGDDPHAYGFDEQAGRVEMVVDGREPVVVTLGGTNPTGTAVYARRGSTPGVVLIGRNVRYYEDLIFQALPASRTPAIEQDVPVGG